MEIHITRKLTHGVVYDAYWEFAAERMAIYFRRLKNEAAPWTKDEVLKTYKFTNAYRVLDRVSQYLIREIILKDENQGLDDRDRMFRILLFKIFNKIETWEKLKGELGEPLWKTYNYSNYSKTLSRAMGEGRSIYSAAYIMASGKSYFGFDRKHENHLKLLEFMINDYFTEKALDCLRMEDLYELLISYPTIGSFLAYQYAIDINYSSLTDFNELEFVKAGPGSLDGIHKCFPESKGYSPEDIIKYVTDQQSAEFERLGISFSGLYGRELQLIDCQNLFCEISKYSRVAFPEVIGSANRTKIKQQYKNSQDLSPPNFPTKWNINFNV